MLFKQMPMRYSSSASAMATPPSSSTSAINPPRSRMRFFFICFIFLSFLTCLRQAISLVFPPLAGHSNCPNDNQALNDQLRVVARSNQIKNIGNDTDDQNTNQCKPYVTDATVELISTDNTCRNRLQRISPSAGRVAYSRSRKEEQTGKTATDAADRIYSDAHPANRHAREVTHLAIAAHSVHKATEAGFSSGSGRKSHKGST